MDTTADLVRRLLEELDSSGISWCHWKSNDMLSASASGENDLDLLVARADMTRCRAKLHELRFTEAVQRPSRRLPGVMDYHGNDPDRGRPIHVHLHSRLVLGDDMTKNYRLPIEEEYLASVRREGLFWVPAVEIELIVFVIRMVLKHCSADGMLMLSGNLSSAEQRELGKLQANAVEPEVRRCLLELLPEVDQELFDACRDAVSGSTSRWQRLQVGMRLERALAAYARRPASLDVPLKAARRLYWAGRRVVGPRSRRKTLAHGGLIVSILGGEGAEQRWRVVAALDEWLRRDVAVLPVAYGTTPRRGARRALRFAAAGGLVLTADHPASRDGARIPFVPPPDLEVVLDGERASGHAATRRVAAHLATDGQVGEMLASVGGALWEHL